MEHVKPLLEKAKALPKEPGVYLMRDKGGNIIYIGKAKVLRNRVSSYFRAVDQHPIKVYKMVENARDFDYIVTDNEFEALVLECTMIKNYQPKYNILLKDDKGYTYIRIYPKEYGKITSVKQKTEEGSYLGPYTSGFVVKQTVEEANMAFMLPTCTRRFPAEFGKARPCLNYHIKRCMGVCRGKIAPPEYQNIIDEAVRFIKSGEAASIKRLEECMQQSAEDLDFEKAALYRDRIAAINRITQRQKVYEIGHKSLDVIAFVQNGQEVAAAVLRFRDGRLVDKQEHQLAAMGDMNTLADEFLASYYYTRADIPKRVYLDTPTEDMTLSALFLTQQAGHKVELSVPSKGEGQRLIEMARNNAAQAFVPQTQRSGKELTAIHQLGQLLGLAKPPEYIEAYDISNIGSATIVGGMVAFENGRPQKNGYRKFIIKELQHTTDDYAAMAEVIRRRLNRYTEEIAKNPKNPQGFARLPDLILLDGGKGHVGVIAPLVQSMGFTIPIFGMVKDSRHRTRAIAQNGGELEISSVRSVFTLISNIQDEVHRFSITFSRGRHQKTGFALKLATVPGIGEKRAQALYKHFKTYKAMQNATVEQLAATDGMTKPAAQQLYDFFKNEG